MATYYFVVLHQHHVVCAQSSDEDDTGHAFKAVDPLLPLWTLTTHIKHPADQEVQLSQHPMAILIYVTTYPKFPEVPEVEVLERELGLDDTGGLDSWSQYVLLGRDIARLDQPLQVIQVA